MTRDDYLEMEQHCIELAADENPENRHRYEKMASRYRAQADGQLIKSGIFTELSTRFLYLFGATFYVVGSAAIWLAEASWRKADCNRGKPPSFYLSIRGQQSSANCP